MGGQLPNVKYGSNLENDGNHLFFVGADRKIYELYWVSGWIGQCTTNATACLVDSALSTIQYCDKYIYYVGDVSGSKKMCWLRSKKYPGFGNDQNILDTTGAEIISNFQVCKITFFPHVFFIARDSCVNLLIRDSNHVACGIRDYDNPSYNTIKWHSGRLNSTAHNIDIQSYFTLSLIGGSSLHVYYVDSDDHVNVFLREVINGTDKPGWSLTYEDDFQDSVDSKNLWDPWPDYNGYDVQALLQDTVHNNPDFVQLGYWSRWDNISFGNLTGTGTVSIESRQESVNKYTFGSIHPPRVLPYDYTTGWLTTGGTNTAQSAYDRVESEWIYRCPDSMQYCKCGTGLPSKENLSCLDCNLHKVVDLCDNFGWKHDSVDLDGDGTFRKFVPPKFYQKYGWFEIRCRAAKGNKMWSAFWMRNKGFSDEIDISEIDGDGRGLLSNIYYDDCLDNGNINGGVSREYNAVGFRFYDAFYTYACEWEPDYAKFYFNNELISTINKSDITNGDSLSFPRDEMIIYINEYIANGNAKRMPEKFPNSFDIVYVRVFQKSDRLALALSENCNEEKKKSIVDPQDLNKSQPQKNSNSEPLILIYPNPASEYLYVDANYQYESNLRWEIYNSFQRKVKAGCIIASGTTNKIDIEMLPIGYYFIRIIGNQSPVVKKFIIKR